MNDPCSCGGGCEACDDCTLPFCECGCDDDGAEGILESAPMMGEDDMGHMGGFDDADDMGGDDDEDLGW